MILVFIGEAHTVLVLPFTISACLDRALTIQSLPSGPVFFIVDVASDVQCPDPGAASGSSRGLTGVLVVHPTQRAVPRWGRPARPPASAPASHAAVGCYFFS